MPVTINVTRTLYQFNELSDKAKEAARTWWREDLDVQWDFVYEDAVRIASLMGIDIDTRLRRTSSGRTWSEAAIIWSGFGSQGDGACFEGTYRGYRACLPGVKEMAPGDTALHKIAEQFDNVVGCWAEPIKASVKHRGHYSHERCTDIEVDLDTDDEDACRAFLNSPYPEIVRETLRSFMRWIYRSLEAEYVYRHSDECVDEDLMANEYTFDVDGKRLDAADR